MSGQKVRVGIVSFTDPRETAAAEPRERYIARKHAELAAFLTKEGFDVVDPMPVFRPGGGASASTYGLNKTQEVLDCADLFNREKVDCMVMGLWHWSDCYLPVHLVVRTPVPTALYCEDDPAWAGSVFVSAVSASLRETVPNKHAKTHARFRGDRASLAKWVRGTGAYQKLRRSSVVLWGGSYSLRMEHLQDDVPKLKSFLISDILQEDQYVLIKKAERILAKEADRVAAMIRWLEGKGTKVRYDGKMLTRASFSRQVALYLAARERLAELRKDGVEGCSIKCQPEIMTDWGATGCMLPGFLPFAADSEGSQPIVPTVCEGDIKGLLSCMLLNKIRPDVPPLFGDVKYIGKGFWIISNCGGASVYYGANSLDPTVALPKVRICGNCHGASGGAVGYFGKPGPMTLARLIRIQGRYWIQLGRGQAQRVGREAQSKIKFGEMWPLHAIKMDCDLELFFEIVGANHFSAMPGDYVEEVICAAREAGIGVVRIDSDDSMLQWREELYRV